MSDDNPQEEMDTTAMDQTDTFTYLALGDSYTIGEAVAVSDRWPVQLIDTLKAKGVEIETPKIIARTGWTTDELLAAIEKEQLTETYDLVSLLIGVNNQYRGYPVSQQETEFKVLLNQAIQFAGGDTSRVFVVSIPDYGVTPFGKNGNPEKIAKEIDEYNALNKRIADLYEVQYFDITPGSREAENNPDLIATDGLHPSGLMYSEWVKLIFPWVYDLLNDQ
ncbi:MAG: SGNH/GDSL hydrolase family protein [Cyclobacteriaceae bacterium]